MAGSRSPAEILSSLGFAALKQLGQNFLTNDSSLNGAENLFPEKSSLLEIGPGLGMVTRYFLKRDFPLVLIEKDKGLSGYLKTEFPELSIFHDDFLEFPPEKIKELGINAVISNLPFYITSPAMVKIVREMPFVCCALLGVQKEVAMRVLEPKGNSLSIFMRATGDVRLFRYIPASSFFPRPEVDAAWIFWKRGEQIDTEGLELLLRGAFWGKRKNLANSLKRNPHWKAKRPEWSDCLDKLKEDALGELLSRRADDLDKDDFLKLLSWFQNCSGINR